MGESNREIADVRAQTDASLGAERATSDTESATAVAAARRLLDDRIERDRLLADIKLLKFRDGVDRTLSRERSDSPPAHPAVSHERESADERKQNERNAADTLLQAERQRSDIAVEENRSKHDALRDHLDARRHDTDAQLSMERQGADTRTSDLGATRNVLGEIRKALVTLQKKEGRQHDVLGAVAHDLRSPLTLISLSADNIAELASDEATRTAAETILLATARMERLISDLLDVTRIESGRLRIVKQRHDVGALIVEVHRLYEPMFRTRGITFTVEAPTGSTGALFDHDRIVQVLSNLLGNAMKFTQSGGTVTLHVERRAEAIAFTVRDNGPGIAQAALIHVFERFWQIESDMRRGLGLGLHICEEIIHAHGGKIRAESEAGRGTLFEFTLPNE